MTEIKTPVIYENVPGILAEGAAKIAQYGNKIFIIGGQTALDAARPLIEGLKLLESAFEIHTYSGYCTKERIGHYAALARRSKADLIAGVGGGSVLDLSKAVADELELPAVTVPTIAATCAPGRHCLCSMMQKAGLMVTGPCKAPLYWCLRIQMCWRQHQDGIWQPGLPILT